ncbi:MAG: 4-hydroxy-3-methylbut-2-enyl diphosphate reductase [Gemmatimonadetes bacterium]|nr:4-hydroxy-3-methylbut-2-enyl diphosphate reductase [Gemmatimonadota bacterium]
MARKFDIPDFYKSPVIARVKAYRQMQDMRKRDLSPSVLDFGPVRFLLARHFGFCFGVENAIEIAYKTLDDHPDRRIYFLNEMIHNPNVNNDLKDRGVEFIFDPYGMQLIPWNYLAPEDIVVVPAFGTTVEIQDALASRGIDAYTYNTTCPFVERVWNRSAKLGESGFSVVVHGYDAHQETRATFSHSVRNAATVVVLDLQESHVLADVIRGAEGRGVFFEHFGHKCSDGFDPDRDLQRIGIVNQTTLLATETRRIAKILRGALADRYGEENIQKHYADTSDTLCYATNENQNATYVLVEQEADLALVVGGYNSSNTSHIVELCLERMPTYFIKDADEIRSGSLIRHYNLETKKAALTTDWLPDNRPLSVALTSGASCPDAIVDAVLLRVLSFFEPTRSLDDVLASYA